MYDKMLLIDKPAGMTSFGVVARVRRVLSEQAGRKIKVGHTGTLDPFATGLLILMTGKYTKKCQEFLKLDKRYEATICLGATSTTGDIEGEIHDTLRLRQPQKPSERAQSRSEISYAGAPAEPPEGRTCRARQEYRFLNSQDECAFRGLLELPKIEAVVKSFQGEIIQRVPAYSAVKINGERAYKLARKGREVEMPTRKVQIYEISILEYKWPYLKIDAKVSSGTYIRTLGEDIGAKLGVGGYLTELRRTEIGEYRVRDAVKLDDFMSRE